MEPPEVEVGRRKDRWKNGNNFSVSMHRKSKEVHTSPDIQKENKAKGFYRYEAHLLADKLRPR